MTTTTATGRTAATSSAVRNGATLMAVAAAGFIGYALLSWSATKRSNSPSFARGIR